MDHFDDHHLMAIAKARDDERARCLEIATRELEDMRNLHSAARRMMLDCVYGLFIGVQTARRIKDKIEAENIPSPDLE